MSNINDTEWLIRMLDGELSATERDALLLRLQNEPALQNEWSVLSMTRELFGQAGSQKEISNIHREMMTEMSPVSVAAPTNPAAVKPLFPARRFNVNFLRAAAAILLIVVSALVYPYFTATPEKLFAGQYATYDGGAVRGETKSTIENDYRSGDETKTMADYRQGLSTGARDDFYAGLAFLHSGQPGAAAEAFQSVTSANTTAGTHYFEAETGYYLGLAWLGAGDPKKALGVFSAIRNDPGNPYHDQISWWFMLKLRRLAAR